ncbi:MAG: DUF3160 domain-containing protein [Deltaproteobacteria bacterium]|nr:DUF3160 domain-containing protein [Deltaproteobacteria bacterium]
MVINKISPIYEQPDAKWRYKEQYGHDDEKLKGVVVYGNIIQVRPTKGRFKDSWLELIDPQDSSNILGYVPMDGLENLPEIRTFNEDFITRIDSPLLLLQPGQTAKKYNLAQYNYSILKGEIVSAIGETSVKGTRWLLFKFSSSGLYLYGDGGVGARYAWGRADDFVAASSYTPDNSRVDPDWLSSKIRLPDPYHPEAGYLPSIPPETLPDSVKSQVVKNGFWIDPTNIYPTKIEVDDMADLYLETGVGMADFISTDLFLHSYHILFDRMLQNLEKTYFSPHLAKNMKLALAELEKIKPQLTTPQAREAYDTVKDLFSVPLVLFGDRTIKYSARVKAEVDLIMDAHKIETSPITGNRDDYTQYRARGHYTLSPELEIYFRAMSYLGNAGFSLFRADGSPNLESVRASALIVFALKPIEREWNSVDGPINYLIGCPDDAGYLDFYPYVSEIIGEPRNIADDARIRRLAEELKIKIPQASITYVMQGNPQEPVSPEDLEFRLSGKRFVFDSYVLNQLTTPRVGSIAIPRTMPMGTDLMSALGSEASDEVSIKNDYVPRYTDSLNRLKQLALNIGKIYPTFYSSWLLILKDLFTDSGSKQFFYRKTGPWKWKKLITAHASWAELRHDTILYVKQSGAETGDLPTVAAHFATPQPRGYVEPDPQVFFSLIVSVDKLLALFKNYSLEASDVKTFTDKLNTFKGLCEKALRIAQREVNEEKLSSEDYATIKELAKSFNTSLLLDQWGEADPNDVNSWRKLSMAIIADLHTDFDAQKILYAATGTPRKIYVFVNDRSGGPRLTLGYMFSYYEYSYPLDVPRLTDETWRDVVYDPSKASLLENIKPFWYSQLDN